MMAWWNLEAKAVLKREKGLSAGNALAFGIVLIQVSII